MKSDIAQPLSKSVLQIKQLAVNLGPGMIGSGALDLFQFASKTSATATEKPGSRTDVANSPRR